MKTKLKENDIEQVSGGNFFADLEEALRRIFADDAKPTQPRNPTSPKPVTGCGIC
jgi:hypothetical protein